MKWIALKLSNVNELNNEYEQVCFNYNQLRANVKLSNTKKAVSELKLLREEIRARIRELEEFYNRHINDTRIGAFEGIKTKLEMLLTNKEPHKAQSPKALSVKRTAQLEQSNEISKEECHEDKEDDKEIFTCSSELLASQLKKDEDWKDVFLKVKLSPAEYEVLFKDATLNSNQNGK